MEHDGVQVLRLGENGLQAHALVADPLAHEHRQVAVQGQVERHLVQVFLKFKTIPLQFE